MWMGLCLIAAFNDEDFWTTHMSGVVLLFGGFTGHVLRKEDYHDSLVILLTACAIYLLRIVLKICVLKVTRKTRQVISKHSSSILWISCTMGNQPVSIQ